MTWDFIDVSCRDHRPADRTVFLVEFSTALQKLTATSNTYSTTSGSSYNCSLYYGISSSFVYVPFRFFRIYVDFTNI